ncbi:hypothetical protein AAL_02969 [Moelleriella libera RCEF 2490]|uniref:Uncharacterized protein n=1 Tax=Moelleriella libera RCEF 2490 TaxID=1081109 RepID=A0A168E5W1_9HYPO|nr:hypothetical protein AAL_02969 [Moelleriella libera RCEF 2490]
MPPAKKWDLSAERDLCMAVIMTGGSTSSYKWPEIHEIMTELGHAFTRDAISFKARHGLKAGKLSNALLSPGKKRKAGSSESEEQEQEQQEKEAQPQESPLAKKKTKTRKMKMEMEDNKALK